MKYQIPLIQCIFFTLFSLGESVFFPYVYPRLKLEAKTRGRAGDPLFLTPYLERGDIDLARNLSRVPLTDKIGFPSYAGFFTVDEDYSSNQYFWYFPPFSKNANAPVLLWLQGGPGGTSLFGLFTEIGPLIAKKEGFAQRKYHWALNNHLIFIDNPVGTGFSFTKDDKGYCCDEDCIAKGLYSSVQQFFELFPELRYNDFFITGESYAGKYIPSLAMEIHRQNNKATQNSEKINLKGLAMGNAYCDPVNQMDYGHYLYQLGLIDSKQLKLFEDLQGKIRAAIILKDWEAADILMDKLLDGEVSNYSYFKNFTGFNYYYNFLVTNDKTDISVFTKLLENDSVRKSIHVGWLPFNSGKEVQEHLIYDMMKSVACKISELLSYYRIMFYNGQLDIVVAYPLTENFLRKLKFNCASEYKTAKRQMWFVGEKLAGYVKKAGNLTEVLVRNAGHMVPHDQPKWALDMITKFTRNKF
ncbi:venom serine carboxypeptidase-like [Pectinophora gossypiella]|nr:venom serine carboxypeptidase-like [Pectinophora gossypiella]